MSSKRKVRVVLWETVVYTRSAIVETELSNTDFEKVLDEAERTEHPEDVELIFENEGIKVVKGFDDDYGSPSNTELEIVEYGGVEE